MEFLEGADALQPRKVRDIDGYAHMTTRTGSTIKTLQASLCDFVVGVPRRTQHARFHRGIHREGQYRHSRRSRRGHHPNIGGCIEQTW